MKIVDIDLGGIKYPVYISNDIRSKIPNLIRDMGLNGDIYFIIDEFIYHNYTELHGTIEQLGAGYYILKGKKNNKTFFSAMNIFSDMDDKNLARDTTIIAIGGGVVGDLAGFIASCWYRGTGLIHIPTTLLSAVDSCLGGKTAINFKSTVNAIGTYYHPLAIFIDTKILAGLPSREISSGFGEIIKYAAIGSDPIRQRLSNKEELTDEVIGWYVVNSLKEKEKYVKNDVQEGTHRLYLNFGHTIGHAIEFSTIYEGEESLRHGEGVALGMIAVFRICLELGFIEQSDMNWLKETLSLYGLPLFFDSNSIGVEREELISRITNLAFKDKKRTKDYLRLVVIQGIGYPELFRTDDKSLICKGISEVIK